MSIESDINTLIALYGYSYTHWVNGYADFETARGKATWDYGIPWIESGAWDYKQGGINAIGYTGSGTGYILTNILVALNNKINAIEPSVVDMSAILKAMSEAEPHQPLLFIAYLEAYKASVWNATFDERFFADLVRKWSIWE